MRPNPAGAGSLPGFPATLMLRRSGRPGAGPPRGRGPLPGPARRTFKLAGIGQAQGPVILDMASAEDILARVGRIEANQAEVNAVLRKYPDQSMRAGLNDAVVSYTAAVARMRERYALVLKRAAGVFTGGGDDMADLTDYEMLDEMERSSAALAKRAEDAVEAAGAPRDSLRRPPPTAREVAGEAKALSAATWGLIIGMLGMVAVSGLIAAAG